MDNTKDLVNAIVTALVGQDVIKFEVLNNEDGREMVEAIVEEAILKINYISNLDVMT